jgi:uncharacterized membrane protein YraQ (UPF0718 family)
MHIRKAIRRLSASSYYLIAVLSVYFALFAFASDRFAAASGLFLRILLNMIPVFIFVFALMVLSNYFISSAFIVKHFERKGARKWLYAIIGGMLATGPAYVWYPLVADLRKKGLGNGLIACFLYNWAIKLPLLPVAIFYFGIQFMVLLTIVMIVTSVIQGKFFNSIIK